jgi:hypothetical protein
VDVNGGSDALVIAVYAALVYDIISATNSSPQTTEINAARRGDTLMKWVHLGLLQATGFIILGAILHPHHWPPLVGGGLAMTLLYAQYIHAKERGTKVTGSTTEDF